MTIAIVNAEASGAQSGFIEDVMADLWARSQEDMPRLASEPRCSPPLRGRRLGKLGAAVW